MHVNECGDVCICMWALFMQFPLFITFIDVRVVQRGLLSAASYVKNVESIVGHKSHGNYGACAPVQMALAERQRWGRRCLLLLLFVFPCCVCLCCVRCVCTVLVRALGCLLCVETSLEGMCVGSLMSYSLPFVHTVCPRRAFLSCSQPARACAYAHPESTNVTIQVCFPGTTKTTRSVGPSWLMA